MGSVQDRGKGEKGNKNDQNVLYARTNTSMNISILSYWYAQIKKCISKM